MGGDAAVVDGGEQLRQAGQGVDFAGGEPDAGQLVAVEAAVGALAAGCCVTDDGNVDPVPQIAQIAKQRGAGNAKSILQAGKGHVAVREQQSFDDAEALGLGHLILFLLSVIITAAMALSHA